MEAQGSNAHVAREWAQQYAEHGFHKGNQTLDQVARFVLDNTTPTTMADMEWDHTKHYLAGVDITETYLGVMVGKDSANQVWVIDPKGRELTWFYAHELTPNGKRYELREVSEPDHPETLKTVADYQNAPEGTIVAHPGCSPWIKEDGMWRSPVFRESPEALALTWTRTRTVLRWGPGDEA